MKEKFIACFVAGAVRVLCEDKTRLVMLPRIPFAGGMRRDGQ
jgi:hypothetical protein